jgi:hypothetical protein
MGKIEGNFKNNATSIGSSTIGSIRAGELWSWSAEASTFWWGLDLSADKIKMSSAGVSSETLSWSRSVVVVCFGWPINPEDYKRGWSITYTEGKRKRLKVSTWKALASTPAISETFMTLVSILFFDVWVRTLLLTAFLLSVDRTRLSGKGVVLGPYMTEEIEEAL